MFTIGSVFRVFCVIFFLLPMSGLTSPVEIAQSSRTQPATKAKISSLLQYISGGHVLGFASQGMYVANGSHALRVDFLDANVVNPLSTDSSENLNASDNATPPLTSVTYPNLWNGVTLTYDATGIVRSTYRIEPYADPSAIRLHYNRPVLEQPNGSLQIQFGSGSLTETTPVAWQEIAGERVSVDVAFKVTTATEIGFALGTYDTAYSLYIDPTLIWNTFLGGSGYYDYGKAVALDEMGNIYVIGSSDASWGSPVRAHTGGHDASVSKLDSSGALTWNTFLGGSGYDEGYDIALDGDGNVYVVGNSSASWGSPVQAFSVADGFAAKLDGASGVLTWNTFLGGSGGDQALGIAADGDTYVTGYSTATWGTPLRAYTAANDAFVAKLDSSGALTWNTFLGGGQGDEGHGIAVDGNGNIYVAGQSFTTWGNPVRAYSSAIDFFAAKLDSSGALMWNTFLGGGSFDYAFNGIAVDGSGNVYVTGYSLAPWGNPIRAYAGGSEGFAAKLNSSGTLNWHTFLGGSGSDVSSDIAVNEGGMIYVGGYSSATWGDPLLSYTSGTDAYVAKLDSGGMLTANTFLGGTGSDAIHGISVDSSSNIYVAGNSEATWGSPLLAYTYGNDAFVAKLSFAPFSISVDQAAGQADPTNTSPINFTATFSEPVNLSTLDSSDITLGGTSVSTLSAVVSEIPPNDGTTFNIAVSGMSGAIGTVSVSMAAGVVDNLTGQTNTASTSNDNEVTYDFDYPIVASILRANTDPTTAASVDFTVTFSEPVNGVDASDFVVTTTGGVSGAAVSAVSGPGTVHTVSVVTGTGSGTIRLDVVDDDSIVDAASNPLGGAGAGNGNFAEGASYTIPSNTRYVSSTGEDVGICDDPINPCRTISYAIWRAAAGNTIEIAAGTYTEAGIAVDKDLTLIGAGASHTIVQAAESPGTATERVFTIDPGVTATIEGLTIQHGFVTGTFPTGVGGGIFNSGTLTINSSTITGNMSNVASGAFGGGGGIFSNGPLTLNDSIVSGNILEGGNDLNANGGGGIFNANASVSLILNNSTISNNSSTRTGGGVLNYGGTVTLNSSSISNNSAGTIGGGVYNHGISTVTLNNSTVSGNVSANSGGGIFSFGVLTLNYSTVTQNTSDNNNDTIGEGGGIFKGSGAVNIKNSIVSGNKKGLNGITDVTADCSGGLTSLGYNLTGLGTGCNLSGTGDMTVVPADVFTVVLDGLADNGGPSQTHALLNSASNPALNAIPDGTNGCGAPPFDFDQRGESRPHPENGYCDIGAYEFAYTLITGIGYVKPDATGENDGTSWADAYTDLQSALAAASQGAEIWVAEGTYYPTSGTNRFSSFTLKNGIAIYGGFDGTETLRSQRDPVNNVTTLSGEIGNPGISDNSYHVVTASGTDNTAILDGFTITYGNANGTGSHNSGGGMINLNGNPVLENVVFTTNAALYRGGALYNSGTLTIENGHFTSNAISFGGGYGAGIYNDGSLTLNDSSVSQNYLYTGNGGGIFNNDSLVLNNSVISENSVRNDGGGLYNMGTAVLNRSLIWGNYIQFNIEVGMGTNKGGGIANHGDLTLNDSSVIWNAVEYGIGGGISNDAALTLNNTTVSGNFAQADHGAISNGGTALVNFSTVVNNETSAGSNGGIGGGTITLKSSIVAANIGANGLNDLHADCSSGVVSQGYNLTGSGTGCNLSGTGDVTIAPANVFTSALDGLDQNGGPTQTHALIVSADNPALNAIPNGTNGCGMTPFDNDQRGEPRPFPAAGHCDIGAYEALTVPPTTRYVSTTGTDIGLCGDPVFPCQTITYAISRADAGNTVEIAAGTYTEPWITISKDLHIIGAGEESTIVQAATSPNTTTSRVFHINGGVTVTIENMTIQNGFYGISNEGGVLTLNHCTVRNNINLVQGASGSIINGINGILTLNNSTVTGNSGGSGGGIFNDGGIVVLNESTVSNNSALGSAGGLWTDGGTITISNSTFSGNTATYDGGGVYNNGGTITISNSTFSGNTATYGGGINSNSVLTLNNSIVRDNSADRGGGIFTNGTLNLNNSTISGNSSISHGGGIFTDGLVTLKYSTVANNRSDSDDNVFGDGGGIYNGEGTLELHSSIVAGNKKGTGGTAESTSDCAIIYTPIDSHGYNLTSIGTGCNMGYEGDVTVIPASVFTAVLEPLADNGGLTQTHALIISSSNPAINVIPVEENSCSTVPFNFDQRGEMRPSGSNCDIGAYESEYVNTAPVITEGDSVSVTLSEDGSPTAFDLTLNATDNDGDTLTWSIHTPASHGTATASDTGMSKVIGYSPTTDYNGSDSFTVQVSDGNDGTDTITIDVTIEAVNDAPSFTAADPPTSLEDAGTQTVTNWATFNPGAANESAQTVDSYTVSAVSNPGLFSTPPSLAPNGTLTYRTANNANGTSTFTVQVLDSGGTAGGGINFSASQTFTITVTAVNDVPTITEGNSVDVTMSQNGSPVAFALTLHAADLDGNSLTWSVSSPASHGTATAIGTGPSKIIGYTPQANYSGTDSFTVQVSDGNGGIDTIDVNVTITAVNTIPGLTIIDPASAQVDDPDLDLAIDGANFALNAIVKWHNITTNTTTNLTTTYVSSTELSAVVPSTLLTSTGTFEVSVFNPAPGGGTSVSLPFFVTQTAASVISSDTATNTNPTGTAVATTGGSGAGTPGSITATGTGTGTITVTIYDSNPRSVSPFRVSGKYFDVYVAQGSNFSSVRIVACNMTAFSTVRWLDSSNRWRVVNPQSYSNGCVTMNLSNTSLPRISQLTGTIFGVEESPVKNIALIDSQGNGLEGATAQYYSNGWHNIPGSTDTYGILSYEGIGLSGNVTFRLTYANASIQKQQNITNNPEVTFQTQLANVQLLASDGTTELAGNAQYYSNGWLAFGNGSTNSSMELLPLNYTFRVSYAGTSIQKQQNVSSDSIITFQTGAVSMKLLASNSTTELAGTGEYYANGWKTFGSGSTSTTMELLPANYTFRVSYGGASIQKQQDVNTNAAVVFQTKLANMQLLASNGTTELVGTGEYYANGWKPFGNGSTTTAMEMLPTNYTFRISYGGATTQKQQDINANAAIVFQTKPVTMQLLASNGTTELTGTAEYYANGWKPFGNGSTTTTMELLPVSYTFRVSYGGASVQKAQDVNADSFVSFQTKLVTMKLLASNGTTVLTGGAEYYANGWKTFGGGSTTTTMELLPVNYTFRVSYGGASVQKQQDANANQLVVFQTGRVHSNTVTATQYYANGWKAFVQDMELLPGSYAFKFNDGTQQTTYAILAGVVNNIH